MSDEKELRPLQDGEHKGVIQHVYIGFVGYKSCGKPVVMDGGPHES